MLALVNGEPKVLTLKQCLEHYLDFQVDVITRRTKFDLKKAADRAHILEGLMIALDFIDEVLRILRASKNVTEGKQALIERFGLSDAQSDAIVKMTFGQLTGMERSKIEVELEQKKKIIAELTEILSDGDKLLGIISQELEEIKRKFGDERRTAIMPVSGEVDIEDLIPVQECVITYTNIGYIKRQLTEVYNIQKRGGKGVSGMKQRDEDFVEDMFICSTHDNILFITNLGNMFKLKCYEIPEGSKQSRGTNIVNLLNLQEGESIAAMMKTTDFDEDKFFICVTKNGTVKRTNLAEYKNVRKNGLRAITLAEGDEIASAHLTEGDSSIIVATRLGQAIRFDENDARAMGRTAKGVRAIKLRDDDYVVGAAKVYDENMTILTVSDRNG